MIENQQVKIKGCRVVPLSATFLNFKTNEKKFARNKFIFGSSFLLYMGTTLQPMYNKWLIEPIEAVFEVVPLQF